MKIGFAKTEITPPVGTELGGYAGYRPCIGVHDPLWCKAVVLEQDGFRVGLLAMDLLSVDESLSEAIAQALKPLEIRHVLVAAIHSHATPCGIVLDQGPLAEVNRVSEKDPAGFAGYMQTVIRQCEAACHAALDNMELFTLRTAQGPAPVIGSERHTGETANLTMTAVQILTESGRKLLLYQIPCHPTVLGPENRLASADFVAGIEKHLNVDMAMFLNGAAGDISTRFTRREQSFDECDRMAEIAGAALNQLMDDLPFSHPEPFRGIHTRVTLQPRLVEPPEAAAMALEKATENWRKATEAGESADKLRILKSYVEGAGVALEFSNTMAGIRELRLPVTVFSFGGLKFVTVPGEMFSSLWNLDAVPICYTNGYYRYIANENAYDAGFYEAMAAILARGQGEEFLKKIAILLKNI